MSQFTILRIDASARTSRSLSRSLADDFVRGWQTRRPGDRILLRDVGVAPPPPISESWIDAAFTSDSQRTPRQRAVLSLSDELIGELRQADLLLIASPLYNYGMPACLKAWVDQVVRVQETFSFDLARGDWPIEPVLEGKTLVLLTSSGEFGFAPGGVRAEHDHLTPHLRTCSRYFGVAEMHRVAIEYQEFGDERHRRSVEAAHAEVGRLVDHLSRQVTSEAA